MLHSIVSPHPHIHVLPLHLQVVELSYEFKNSGFPARPSSRLVHSMFTHSLPSSAQSKDCSPKRSTSSEMSHCGSRQSGGCVTVVVVMLLVIGVAVVEVSVVVVIVSVVVVTVVVVTVVVVSEVIVSVAVEVELVVVRVVVDVVHSSHSAGHAVRTPS
jgi:Flp pilus assembly protein TadB